MDSFEKTNILSDFPSIKLSYETTIHKKVYNADLVTAIPDGNKYYAWFTTVDTKNVCWLLELSTNNTIVKVSSCMTSFSDSLSYGTILYGTLFMISNNKYFSIEDIFYYRGENIQDKNYFHKLTVFEKIMSSEMSMERIGSQYVVFGIPFMDTQFLKVLNEIPVLPYKSSTIQFRYLEGENSRRVFNMKYIRPRTQYLEQNRGTQTNKHVFKVVADIQNDIYKLYTLENGIYVYYDTAHIPSYTTSVMMNRLFRYIKENNNLDALEESDDEEEFENNELDKYVFLDRDFLMNCELNHKFKKWTPINLASDGAVVVSKKQLSR
jgi:hypothetical protein